MLMSGELMELIFEFMAIFESRLQASNQFFTLLHPITVHFKNESDFNARHARSINYHKMMQGLPFDVWWEIKHNSYVESH